VDNDDSTYIPGVSQNWHESKRLVVLLDGDEIIRRDILGVRVEGGTQQCTDPECIGHIIPDEIVCVTALVAPPHERLL
jgi:hypothetical protein